MAESSTIITLKPDEGIFGLPPLNNLYVSKHVVVESMPIVEIVPCEPDFSSGMSLFRVNPETAKYDSILQNLGFKTSHPIKFAYLADNFPSDSFSNDFGETFLQGMTDIGAQKIQEIVQMTGKDTLSGAMSSIAGMTKSAGEQAGGFIGKGLETIGGMASSGSSMIKSLENMAGLGTVGKMLSGHRVDFPSIWKNSGFTPSYTITIRLFNSLPGNYNATTHSIIGPLAVLLSLATPRTKDGYTYKWPFFHKIKCPGVFSLDPAVITNITVIKGGDQQQIGWNQRLGIVDVRVDFGSLYNSMVCEEGDVSVTNRPTVQNYLQTLEEEKKIENHYQSPFTQSELETKQLEKQKNKTTNISLNTNEENYETGPRVPQTITDKYDLIMNAGMPSFL